MESLWTDGRSEWIRPASHLTTDPAGIEAALLEDGDFSAGVEAVVVASPEGAGTEATGVAASSPGVGPMEAPETTMPAGVRVAAMVTGARVGPTETATTVTVDGKDAVTTTMTADPQNAERNRSRACVCPAAARKDKKAAPDTTQHARDLNKGCDPRNPRVCFGEVGAYGAVRVVGSAGRGHHRPSAPLATGRRNFRSGLRPRRPLAVSREQRVGAGLPPLPPEDGAVRAATAAAGTAARAAACRPRLRACHATRGHQRKPAGRAAQWHACGAARIAELGGGAALLSRVRGPKWPGCALLPHPGLQAEEATAQEVRSSD